MQLREIEGCLAEVPAADGSFLIDQQAQHLGDDQAESLTVQAMAPLLEHQAGSPFELHAEFEQFRTDPIKEIRSEREPGTVEQRQILNPFLA